MAGDTVVATAEEPGSSLEQGGLSLPSEAGDGRTLSAQAAVRCAGTKAWLESHGLLEESAERYAGIVYDEAMTLHVGPPTHPEQPARIRAIRAQLEAAGLLAACASVPSREATKEELIMAHDEGYVEKILSYDPSKKKVKSGSKPYAFPFGPDTYVCKESTRAALLASGSLLSLVDACFDEDSSVHCGMAVVRPPGHHATPDRTSGFCLFNNAGVAARYMQQQHGLDRVAIIDWDVHHGNGTNDIFHDDEDVLFFSMHRYDTHGFFPGTGFMEDAGKADARGLTVNVPLSKGYGDQDACHVVRYVLCPLLEKFKPEAIIVSAGFDAVKGDPLGDCRMSPEGFGWFTRCLHRMAKQYCEGRLLLVLEGGYNPDLIAQCSVECVQALVGESAGIQGPWTKLPSPSVSHLPSACATPSAPGTPAQRPSLPGVVSAAMAASQAAAAAAGVLRGDAGPESPRCSSTAASERTPPRTPTSHGSGFDLLASPEMTSAEAPKQKSRAPNAKTVKAVRKVTEIHSILAMELPLAPKDHQSTSSPKNSKKNERRRSNKSGGEDSDASGWSIASGGALCDVEPIPSPASRVSSRKPFADEPPELELPPNLGDGAGGESGVSDASAFPMLMGEPESAAPSTVPSTADTAAASTASGGPAAALDSVASPVSAGSPVSAPSPGGSGPAGGGRGANGKAGGGGASKGGKKPKKKK